MTKAKEQSNELLPLENLDPIAVFQNNGLQPLLDSVRKEAMSLVPDTETEEGRKAIASMAYNVARSKTAIDDIGKNLVSDWKNKAKVVDAERKRARETLDDLRDEVRQPLNDYEDAEANRIQKHTDAITAMRASGNEAIADDVPLEQLIAGRTVIEAIDPAKFEEFAENAEETRLATLAKFDTAIAKREQHDKDQAELAELRAAREEQERKDAEAKAEADRKAREEQVAAEAKAEAEKQAELARQREEVATAAAAAAEQRAAEAEERAKAELEAEQKAERKAAAEEKAARERNTRHKGEINSAAAEALMTKAGLDAKQARKVVTAIAKGQIPAVVINY